MKVSVRPEMAEREAFESMPRPKSLVEMVLSDDRKMPVIEDGAMSVPQLVRRYVKVTIPPEITLEVLSVGGCESPAF